MGRTKTEAPGGSFGKNDPGQQYANGQDVGHGPNHPCLQCRIARRALETQAHIPNRPAEGGPDATQPGEPMIDPPDIPLPPVDEGAENVEGLSGESAPAGAIWIRNMKEEPAISSGATDALGKRSVTGTLGLVPAHFASYLDGALDAAWMKAGIVGDVVSLRPSTLCEEEDAIAIIDELRDRKPGVGVMIMQGYVPNDDRWHIELNAGTSRSHIKFIDREIAIKLAVLSLLDGQKGAELERTLAPYNTRDPISHFTGAEQANYR